MTLLIQGGSQKTVSGFFGRKLTVPGRGGIIYFKAKREKLPNKNAVHGKLSSRNKGEIKLFPDKQKLREFITTSPAL